MLLRDVPIKVLLIAGFLLSGLLPLMVVALMSLSVARDELNYQAVLQLESVRDLKRGQLKRFFDERMRQTEVLAADPYVRQALRDFMHAIHRSDGVGRISLIGHGERSFTAPQDYLDVHTVHDVFFHTYARGNRYYDLFLMDPSDGYTYFTVEKEADFGVAISGVDSSLQDVWSIAAHQGRVALSDTRPYGPSHNLPAQFIAAPVFDNKKIIGVIAVQISLDAINEFMRARPGMGETGETYLVGNDFRMRSDSYLDPQAHSVETSFSGSVPDHGVQTQSIHAAFAGHSGAHTIVGYLGQEVISAYAPVQLQTVTWAIVAEIDKAEIDAKIAAALNDKITLVIVLSLVLLLVLALTISLFISKGIARVKNELSLLMDGVLAGNAETCTDPQQVAYDFREVLSKTIELINAYRAKTEQSRKLEDVIAYNQRMESIGTFAGGIAHDFNNILAYMLTYGDLVLDDLDEGSPAYERMQEILAGIDRAGELVAQIMTFGRQLKRDTRPVEIALIVKETTKLLKTLIPKNIKVQCDVGDKHMMVLADPTQLHRIVMNLGSNAFHSMLDTGGMLSIALHEQSFDDAAPHGLRPGRYSVLELTDTGHGIPAEIRDRIVEPFFTTKAVGQGSGMGLAVVHGIVSSYAGALTFDSEVNRGTTVRVFLPMQDQLFVEEQSGARSQIVRGRGCLLFVDDEEAICAATALVLESLGYTVDAHMDPVTALAAFSQHPRRFVAVVTDVNMAELNGLELVRRMRVLRPRLPVLLVTGYNDLMTTESAAELEVEVLLKPFKKSVLSQVLAKLTTSVADLHTDP